MKLIIGLGNPEKKQKNNRHNIGFMVVDKLREQLLVMSPSEETRYFEIQKKLGAEIFKLGEMILAKPQTYMNASGKAVSKLVKQYKIDVSDVWVIHDDLDIPLGEYKIQQGKGPRLHNGVNSIENSLGTTYFWRVRVGVENREKENRIPGEAYVLQDFNEKELEILATTIDKMSEEIIKETK